MRRQQPGGRSSPTGHNEAAPSPPAAADMSLMAEPSYYAKYYSAHGIGQPGPPTDRGPMPRPPLFVVPPAEDDAIFGGMGMYCWQQPDHLPAPCASESIYVGSVRHASSLHLLRRHNITHVLNVAAGEVSVPHRAYAARGIAYAEVEGLDQEGYPLLLTHLKRCLSFLHPCLMAGGGGKALVFCSAGRNRSATLAVASVMLALHMPLPVVLRRLFHRRPFVLTNISFRQQLIELASANNLLSCPQGMLRLDGKAAGPAGRGVICEYCGQPHGVSPEARMDFSLRCDCSALSVHSLHTLLASRLLGDGSDPNALRIEIEVGDGNMVAGGGRPGSLLLPTTYELPVVALGRVPLAGLPRPIRGPPGRLAALLVCYDTERKAISTVGVHDTDESRRASGGVGVGAGSTPTKLHGTPGGASPAPKVGTPKTPGSGSSIDFRAVT